MAINTRGNKPAGDYKWTVSTAGTAGKKGKSTLQLRKTKAASFGRTEYIYSGELEMGGSPLLGAERSAADANLSFLDYGLVLGRSEPGRGCTRVREC